VAVFVPATVTDSCHRVRSTPAAWHQAALNGAIRRAQFCANPRFSPALARSDVKTFTPRCRPVVVRRASALARVERRRALRGMQCCLSTQSAYFKRFLFSTRDQLLRCAALPVRDAALAGRRAAAP